MFKIFGVIYITSLTVYALANNGVLAAISIFVFIGIPTALGYAIGLGEMQ